MEPFFLTVSHNFKADSQDNANDWNITLSAGLIA